MSTPTPDGLKKEIEENSNVVGNPVKASDNTPATASKPIYVDSSSDLASGAFPFSVPITPSAATVTFLNVTGTGTADVMTSNVVVDGTGGATTFTKKGYIKVSITDTGDVLTDGDYYIQVGTLT